VRLTNFDPSFGKRWVRAAYGVAAVAAAIVVMAPIDWCEVVGVCGTWFAFLCDHCPPLP
jgi:hypothetical protein